MTSTPHKPESLKTHTRDLLANRYKVIKTLGEGGFGKTYLATDTQMPSQRACVVKQLKSIADDPQIHQLVQERFQREAAILERLGGHSTQIPDLFAYFSEGDQFYLVEEWIAGETLHERIQRTGPMTEPEVILLLNQLLPVIDSIHRQQIVHRDIKPDNIILREQDNQPVLIDFGAVKEALGTVINSQGNSSRSIVVGTPGFMPPEQSAGRPVFSSDLYSLGLTAIYLLTGKIPQDLATNPQTGQFQWQSFLPNLHPNLAQVLDRATQIHIVSRFPTAAEMHQALGFQGADTPIHASETPTAWKSTVISHPQPQSVPPPNAQPFFSPANPEQSHGGYHPPSTSSPAPASSRNDWIKAVAMGSIIGVSILGGTLILRGQIAANRSEPAQPQAQANSQSNSQSSQADTKTPQTFISPESTRSQQPQETALPPISPNATVTGDPGRKNIRSGPGTNYRVLGNVYPGDRIQVIGNGQEANGFTWYKVMAPSANTEGWMAHHLVTLDGAQTARTPVNTAPPPQSFTNAVVVGGGVKNIRSGPGTIHGVVDTIATSERVRIIGTDFDSGGYRWYNIISGQRRGWIAAQLLERD